MLMSTLSLQMHAPVEGLHMLGSETPGMKQLQSTVLSSELGITRTCNHTNAGFC